MTKKNNQLFVWGWDRMSRSSGLPFANTRQNGDSRDGCFYPTLTVMIASYNAFRCRLL